MLLLLLLAAYLTAQPQIKGLTDGGGGHIPCNTSSINKHTHTHITSTPTCVPTHAQPPGQTLS